MSPAMARLLMVLAVILGGLAGGLATAPDASAAAVAAAGDDLTRLLRAMAGLKMLLAAGAVAAVYWRLGRAVGAGRLAGYAASGAAMAAGPGLIWTMMHVGAGALLLHGGLLAAIVLLWRDPVVGVWLAEIVAAKRRRLVG